MSPVCHLYDDDVDPYADPGYGIDTTRDPYRKQQAGNQRSYTAQVLDDGGFSIGAVLDGYGTAVDADYRVDDTPTAAYGSPEPTGYRDGPTIIQVFYQGMYEPAYPL